MVGDPALPGDQQSIARWFNTSAFVLNDLGTWGNGPRNNFTGPGITSLDASIIRNFRLFSNKTLQFRLEAFNALNTPVFSSDPNLTPTSTNFGKIIRDNGQSNASRSLQFGFRFMF